ncbi:MAG: signal peptidase II [Bacilli bacterium]|nr:signal peptidase II [Bacilli bacterium]
MKKREVLGILFLLLLDQGSKFFVENYVRNFTVIPNFFEIHLTYNTGAAWSLLSNQVLFLSILSILALIVLTVLKQGMKESKLKVMSFTLIYAGILGNLGDRMIFHHVKDFLKFNIFGYEYPVFNLADIFIVVGGILLTILFWKEGEGHEKLDC